MVVPQADDCGAVRIVVCGPAGCGKTCFVTAAATETFPVHVPPLLPPTLLSLDALPDRVPVLLVDTSSRAEDRTALAAALATAHAVVLCYGADVPRPATLALLREEWLPELRRAGRNAPVVLLGCKFDLRASSCAQGPPLATELLAELPCIEVSLECSAKLLVAVQEAVYAAHRAVLYPLVPLFDAGAQALAPDAVAALRRIFTVCDADGDGVLSSGELSAFQEVCFGAPLAAAELDDIRRIVSEQLPGGAGVASDGTGLTLSGFLYLHALFIEHGRADTVWTVLRSFGYDGRLRLSSAAMGAGLLSGKPPDAAVELSERALAFVDALYARATAATGCLLHESQLEDMFATAPGGAAGATRELGWTACANWDGAFAPGGPGLSQRAFSALWSLAAAVHSHAALEHLLYLGYPGSASSVLWQSRRRAGERTRSRAGARCRSTVQVFVCGAHGAGQRELLEALAALGNTGVLATPSESPRQATASVLETGRLCGTEATGDAAPHVRACLARSDSCYAAAVFDAAPLAGSSAHLGPSRVTLVMRHVDASRVQHILQAPADVAAADVFIFLFDPQSRDSFEAAAAQLTALASTAKLDAPALLVAARTVSCGEAKRHGDELAWDAGVVDAFRASLGLPPPLVVAPRVPCDPPTAHFFARLAAEALATSPAVPETRAALKARLRRRFMRRSLACTAGAVAAAGSAVVLYRWFRRARRQD